MRIKGKKATISITLPPSLVKKARGLGLNISKVSENALKDYIERLEGSKNQSNSNSNFSNSVPNSTKIEWTGLVQCPRLSPLV